MCAENLGRRVVATGGVWIRRSIMDPLTRLAPADESAGCDPPSPPRGRGLGILRIERFVNVETPDGGRRPPLQPDAGTFMSLGIASSSYRPNCKSL